MGSQVDILVYIKIALYIGDYKESETKNTILFLQVQK
jgi:hypothetical protein